MSNFRKGSIKKKIINEKVLKTLLEKGYTLKKSVEENVRPALLKNLP